MSSYHAENALLNTPHKFSPLYCKFSIYRGKRKHVLQWQQKAQLFNYESD